MPLRTSVLSQEERRRIEQEWDEERSYALADLSSSRRGGLQFVRATKSDEEWIAESHRAAEAASIKPPQPSTASSSTGFEGGPRTEEHDRSQAVASFYRDLARLRLASQDNRIGHDVNLSTNPDRQYETPMAAAARRRREEQGTDGGSCPISAQTLGGGVRSRLVAQPRVKGEGSKTQPFELSESDSDSDSGSDRGKSGLEHPEPGTGENALATTTTTASLQHGDSTASLEAVARSSVTPEETPHTASASTREEGEPLPTDMYCLLCKIIVPAADVPKHSSSVLHQLSKASAASGTSGLSQPLVPPTQYALRPASNVGYGMLQKLGWSEESGLGAGGKGRKTPLKAQEKFDRKGVGVNSSRRTAEQDDDGKALLTRSNDSSRASTPSQTSSKPARPLAKNKRELVKSKLDDMKRFKEGLAYLNS